MCIDQEAQNVQGVSLRSLASKKVLSCSPQRIHVPVEALITI